MESSDDEVEQFVGQVLSFPRCSLWCAHCSCQDVSEEWIMKKVLAPTDFRCLRAEHERVATATAALLANYVRKVGALLRFSVESLVSLKIPGLLAVALLQRAKLEKTRWEDCQGAARFSVALCVPTLTPLLLCQAVGLHWMQPQWTWMVLHQSDRGSKVSLNCTCMLWPFMRRRTRRR